jgi:formylglycine-generating enzyme required for sulfatase activity
MPEKFDPYHEWLGIPASEQPPNHYRLLGISAFEENPTVVENAADQRMAHLRTFQTGKHSAESQRLLNDVAAARICLLHPQKKTAYDEWLRQQLQPSGGEADRGLADLVDLELAAVLEAKKTGASTITSGGAGKKPQPKPAVLIGAAALAVAVVGLTAIWWAMGRGGAPSGRGLAKADLAPPANAANDASSERPAPSRQKTPVVASAGTGEASKVDAPQAAPVVKPSEPKAEEPAKTVTTPAHVIRPEETVEAKPASNDSAAEKPEPEEKAPEKKFDPPSADEQKRLIHEIDEVYMPGEAKDQAAKTALARKLLEDGQKDEAKRAEQFVLLRRAGEIACDAGDADVMLEAVDAIAAAGFNIQPIPLKSRLLKRLVEQGFSGGAGQISPVIASCVKFAEEAAAGGAVQEASDVLDAAQESLVEPKKQAQKASRAARTAAARVRNPADKAAREKKAAEAQTELEGIDASQSALADCTKGLQQARREYEAIRAAQERLKTAPDDPDACLAVGRWHCFSRDEWEEGLKLLAKGSDEALKSLAAEELASKPSKAEDKVARGDAWWELADKATGKARSAMRRRAGHWYQEAMPDLAPGLGKVKVEKRLAEAAEEPLPQAGSGSARIRPPLAVVPFNEKTAQLHQARWAKYLHVPVVRTNSIGMKLVLIPPGEFDMGSSKDLVEEELRLHSENHWYRDSLPNELPRHRVRTSKPFWLGVTEVTQEEYQQVMGNNPSKFQGDPKRPVEQVSWDEAAEFCSRLSELPAEKTAKRRYQLPSEAEWEFACRAGNPGPWCFSNWSNSVPTAAEEKLLEAYGWCGANSGGKTHAVGQKKPNAFGLYDMYGNVSEWCRDWYNMDYYGASPLDDPAGPSRGGARVDRGGTWLYPAWISRSAIRLKHWPGDHNQEIGFRVSLALADTAAERAMMRRTDDTAKTSGASTTDTPSPAGATPDSQSPVRLPAVGSFVGADGKWELPRGAPPPAVAPFNETTAKQHQARWAKYLRVPVVQTNSIGMKLVLIPPGEFMMGSPKELIEKEVRANPGWQWYRDKTLSEGPQHRVRITRPYWLGVTKVTQEEYQRVMGKNPSQFSATGEKKDKVGGQDTRQFPVENVSLEDVVQFCRRLSELPAEKAAKRRYELPTEAPWEHACRAGSTTRYCFGDEESGLSEYAWFNENAGGQTRPVAQKRPNAWGLYDMHGNVWERCEDRQDKNYYAKSPTDDPTGSLTGFGNVTRGGSWFWGAALCRSAYHADNGPQDRNNDVGFRVSLVPADK